ncbi:uroporphyrinogen-III C-methyltransferase [Hirschia baltica]|uniref:uroporphyrinogen-III C-methyltransferase n=1 Tax=Hirschia baltica (strain ATCC 49814 / DSM 5838 / IFAM 1418) TaxID=582402 RepID=C6XN33_HIRBI|nr:uroporphyrinogen-III C-methyltransferase [Hirschia baltica]ACT58203.1 uroporphyrin-III C-methyltransferase [Hirschia baltica ATCC 49814]
MTHSPKVDKSHSQSFASGSVCLIGAGPGDAELLTLKALKRLQLAQIVFYDRLVGADIMDLIPEDAVRVPVGKSKGDHSVPQTQIHVKLIEAAKAGLRVVRLKGGDPFIFGRGGEEVQALRAAGIVCEVVPGISSALGCAAAHQIPLTHRDHAQSVTFVTGHAKLGDIPDLDWNALARANQTVVVYMGVGTAPAITDRLMRAGRDGSTPVAIIENGTRADEKVVYGQLERLPDLLELNNIAGPALLVIGEVSALGLRTLAESEFQHFSGEAVQ